MKTLVIGGGMSGLTYAIVAAANGNDLTVVEKNSRVGKKIAMTGNGKCNIGNALVDSSCYNKSSVVTSVLADVTVEEYRRFLESCGIYTYQDAEARMYPLSDSASNVVDCLRRRLARVGGKTICGAAVTACVKTAQGYQVVIGGKKELFDKVVLACGSGSQAEAPDLQNIVGADKFTQLFPSLVPVKTTNMDGVLNGIRVKADVSLQCDGKVIARQNGEVLFKDYGLSGICIFNLSAVIARHNVAGIGGNYTFVVDLVPSLEEDALVKILSERLKQSSADALFYGILHNKVAECVVKRCRAGLDAKTLAKTAKNMLFRYEKLLDWSKSQVTAGGIDEKFVDKKTLTLDNGIVALGEVLNVDGVCGGNNLFFAAASALHVFSTEERQTAYSLSW